MNSGKEICRELKELRKQIAEEITFAICFTFLLTVTNALSAESGTVAFSGVQPVVKELVLPTDSVRITGRVVDSLTWEEIEFVRIMALDGNGVLYASTISDSNGIFSFCAPKGKYYINFTYPGIKSLKINCDCAKTDEFEMGTVGLVFLNVLKDTVHPVGNVTIKGRVVNLSEKGLDSVIIKVFYGRNSKTMVAATVSDRRGVFSVKVPKGRYNIEFEHPGYVPLWIIECNCTNGAKNKMGMVKMHSAEPMICKDDFPEVTQ